MLFDRESERKRAQPIDVLLREYLLRQLGMLGACAEGPCGDVIVVITDDYVRAEVSGLAHALERGRSFRDDISDEHEDVLASIEVELLEQKVELVHTTVDVSDNDDALSSRGVCL